MPAEIVLEHFRAYYQNVDPADLSIPELSRREFGFLRPDKKEMIRHVSFSDAASLKRYLISMGVAHVYSSTAIYQRPSEPDMNSKGWLGSEMIFEFDADHLRELRDKPNVKAGVLDDSDWALLKQKTQSLINDFLVEDFGIDEKNISVNFSGNRGFHVRVSSPDFMLLEQEGRRRLASYVNGADLDINQINERIKLRGKARDVALSQPGWMSKIRKHLEESGAPLEEVVRSIALDIDENVLLDLHRLIRHKNTLHAATGLIVTPVRDLDEFKPYQDALFSAGEEVDIRLGDLRPFSGITVGNLQLVGDESWAVRRVERSVAVFLLLKGLASELTQTRDARSGTAKR